MSSKTIEYYIGIGKKAYEAKKETFERRLKALLQADQFSERKNLTKSMIIKT